MAVIESLKPVTGSWRVIGARWLLYMLAVLPGMLSLSRHLDSTIGTRPWFHDLQPPLNVLSTKLMMAELGDGLALLGAGVAVIWLLQLVWFGGSVQVLDQHRPQARKNVFSHGWPFLARFIRIAVIALLVTLVLQLVISKVFAGMSARAEVEGWAVYDAFITLNMWKAGVIFVVLTVVGVIAFWMRVIAVVENRPDTRRLPWQVLTFLARNPLSAFGMQFLLICVVLVVQAMALWCWRQSGSDSLWYGLWVLLQFLTAYVWHFRIRLALNIV
jgi:hypothetical protein